jgi:hypothetical protein
MGSRGGEAMVTAWRSRFRVARRDEGTRKPKGGARILRRIPTRWAVSKVNRHPVLAIGATCDLTILNEGMSHGVEE